MPWVTLTILPGTNVTITANKDIHNLFGWMICDGIIGYDLLAGIKQEDNTNCGVHKNEPYRDERHHVSIVVLGELEAIGTEEERIVFKSDSETPGIYDWNKFIIRSGVLSYANVENYRALGVSSDVEISHNNLRNMGECGVCMGKDENPKLLYNNISYAGHELIDMHSSSPIIRYNNLGRTQVVHVLSLMVVPQESKIIESMDAILVLDLSHLPTNQLLRITFS